MSSRQTFERAIEVVLAHEGGYSDHPADRGGPTNYGLSSRANPDVDIEALTRDEAVEIYWSRYWTGKHYDLLPERIAVKVFDLAVNMGHSPAVCCLQRALRAVGQHVTVDGLVGRETAGAAAMLCELAVISALRSEAAGEYRVLLVRNPTLSPFASGWLSRAYS